jgi:hypothetical protein
VPLKGKEWGAGLKFHPNLLKIFADLSFKIYVRKLAANLIQKAANVTSKIN